MNNLEASTAQIQMTVIAFGAELKSAVLAYDANDFDAYNRATDYIMKNACIELWQLVEALSFARESLPEYTPEAKTAPLKQAPLLQRMANAAKGEKWTRALAGKIERSEVAHAGW